MKSEIRWTTGTPSSLHALKTLGESALVPLKSRGEGGMTSFNLPDDWDSAQVMAYAFAVSDDGKRTSATVNLTIGTGD